MSGSMDARENEIYTKVLKAGKRRYFFDVRETRAGDYYLTITESKRNFSENGEVSLQKHKIYLYKEDFRDFVDMLSETTDFIFREKGEEVISEKHEKEYNPVTGVDSFTIESEEDL